MCVLLGTLWNLSAHPTLEGQLLELAVEPLLNQVIIPYAASLAEKSKADNVQMVDLFTHAVGVLRFVQQLLFLFLISQYKYQ